MTPDRMAALHALGFRVPRPWTAEEFATLLKQPGVLLFDAPEGFALARVVADEAELLTITVAPAARRTGQARRLMAALLDGAAGAGALSCFLEVAADNAAAQALYAKSGFRRVGLRRGYYRDDQGRGIDAVVMARALAGDGADA